MARVTELLIDKEVCAEVYNIGNRVFHPLKGFMDSADYRSVVENMHLDNGTPWTIPVTLDISESRVSDFIKADKVILKNKSGEQVAELLVEDVYKTNFDNDVKKVFGTTEEAHPGVGKELSRSPYRVGGPMNVFKQEDNFFPEYSLSPQETKKRFQEKGWQTVVGFQTRNPIHRAHEYLQKIGMEITDGIFIHPLIGWKKADDFSPMAIVKSYEKMLENFYPRNKTMLGVLKTPMRYAGPREAIFHAIIRRNYGCTHFIVGRDHAGVGNYYRKYEAHELSKKFNNLGIEILCLNGPYYCKKCEGIVTKETCPHQETYALHISGTHVRSLFLTGKRPPVEYMRKEISDVLIRLSKSNQLLCGEGKSEF